MNIGRAIKETRKLRDINQGELAQKAKLTQNYMSQIERGKQPSPQAVNSIAKALEVPVAYLVIHSLEDKDFEKFTKAEILLPIVRNILEVLL